MILNPYLNFDGNAEEAFHFYQFVFGGESLVMKMKDAPESENLSEEEKNMALHVSLLIGSNQVLMASDCVKSMGHVLKPGNNNYISLSLDSRDEATRIFNELSAGGE